MTALLKKSSLKTKKAEKIIPSVAKREKPVELKTLLKWKAPARPFKKRDREYYTAIGAIVILLAVILLFLKEWLLIAVIVALAFVAYVLATVSPEKVEHEITSRGVVVEKKLYQWKDLNRFWFSVKWKDKILNIDTKLGFPARFMMLLGEIKKEDIKEILNKYVQYEVPEKTFLDKSAKWLSDKVPLEKKE